MSRSASSDPRRGGPGMGESRRRRRRRPTVVALEDRKLLSIVVNNPTDMHVDGQIDLREAIVMANTDGGGDTITFDPTVFSSPQTITLGGSQLELTGTKGTTTITGPAGGVTVSGGGASRVFQVDNLVTASISGLTITGGKAAGYFDGGGLLNLGTAGLTNCTVSGNTAGGGLSNGYSNNHGSSLTLTNCTVSGNAGVSLFTRYSATTATNTIIAGNVYNVVGSLDPASTHNLIDVDPLLAPLGNYGGTGQSMALLPGSPAIDAGISGTGIPTTDERGLSRVGAVDIGAFESQGFTLTRVAGSTPQSTVVGTAFTHPLAVTVTSNNLLNPEPVDGGVVSFAAGRVTGATAMLLAPSAVIQGGQAAVIAAPNNAVGTYAVVASGPGLSPASFALTNAGPTLSSLVVNTTSDSLFPGTGLLSLREAIAFANLDSAGISTITFDKTAFAEPQTIILSGSQLELSNPSETVAISGPGANLLSVSGGGTSRVFYINHGSAALSGLTITGGNASDNGRLNLGGGLGGGLFNFGGTTTLTNATVSGNSAEFFGGGLGNLDGTTTLTNATVSGNTGSFGGSGLFNLDGTTTLTNATVSGNTTSANGGGLYNVGGTTTLTNATVSGNTAVNGAGLFNGGGTFFNESYNPGGIYELDGTTTLTNVTVSGNTASSSGGGLYDAGGTTTLTNTIVAGQKGGGDVEGALTLSSMNNLIGDGSGMTGISNASQGNKVGTTLNPINSLLAPLSDYGGPTFTMPPLPGSPAIDRGTTGTGIPTTDQRGFAWDLDAPDIGAAESSIPLVVNTTAGGVGSGPGQLSLRQAVNLANLLSTADTITFDRTVFPTAPGSTPQTITLTTGQLTLTDTAQTTITGPGANLLSVSGNRASRVFAVYGSAALSGLTITGGNADHDGGGLYNGLGTTTLTNVTVSGNSAPNSGGGLYNHGGTITLINATVSGNSSGHGGGGLCNLDGTATLINATVSGNSSSSGGGGLYNFDGTITLTNATVCGNTDRFRGGGLCILGGTATLTNATVSGNTVVSGAPIGTYGVGGLSYSYGGGGRFGGGGLFNIIGATATLTDCTVSGNSAYDGGGLLNVGTAGLTNCTVSGNSATSRGGGLYNIVGTTTLTNATVSGNTAVNGAGLFNGGGPFIDYYSKSMYDVVGTTTLTNVTVSGNTASSNGGGLYNHFGTTTLTNATVSGNTASNGGGLYNHLGTTTLTNATVSGNTASNGGGLYNHLGTTTLVNTIVARQKGGGDVTGSYSGTYNLIGGNPLLAPLDNYGGPTQTMALLPGSPAIDAGTSIGAPATDQRGASRVGAVDIGAFESQGFILTPVAGSTPQSTVVGTAFTHPLAMTVTSNNLLNPEPVNGGVINFAAPASGASATLSAASATIAGSQASVTATANTTHGAYSVTASATEAGAATFQLTNLLHPVQPSFSGLTDHTITYGATNVTFTGTLAAGTSIPAGESVSVTLNSVAQSATIQSDGSFSTTFATTTLGAAGLPYTVSYSYTTDGVFLAASGTSKLKVNQAQPVVSWTNPADIYYGTALTATQLKATASVPGVFASVAGTFAYSPNSGTVLHVGQGQSLSVTFTPADPADFLSATGHATINVLKATPTLTVTGVSATYDTQSHPAAFTITGVNGDNLTSLVTVTYNGSSTPPVNAGTYTVKASFPGNSDYTTASAQATFTITPVPLTITVANQTKVYGQFNPTLTGTVNGILNSDPVTVVYATSATQYSDVVNGGYAITVAGLTGAKAIDYSFDPTIAAGALVTNGTLTVTPAPLTITVGNQTKVYGQTNPTLTGTVNGVLNSDPVTVVYATIATQYSDVGAYPITVSGLTGAKAIDYSFNPAVAGASVANGTLTVTPAPLTITVDNKTKVFGAAVPTLTGTVTGISNNDPVGVSYSTTATASSPVQAGGYPITVSALTGAKAIDYSVNPAVAAGASVANGTLTITSASPNVSVNPVTIPFGTALANSQLTGTATWTVNGQQVNVTGTFTYTTAAGTVLTPSLAAYSESVTFTPTDGKDYKNVSTSVTITAPIAPGSVFVLDASAAGALTIANNGSIKTTGPILVNSSSASAITASNNAVVQSNTIDVVGGIKTSNNATLGPKPLTGFSAFSDPLGSLTTPDPVKLGLTNQGAVNISGNTSLTIQPGIYTSITVSGNARLTLAPGGIYIIAGGGISVSGNGSLSGNGVFIYNGGSNMVGSGNSFGALNLSGNGKLNLSAMTTGTYAGVLFFQPRDNTMSMNLSGNGTTNLGTGIIYAAAAVLNVSNNSTLQNTIVIDKLNVSNNAIIT